MAREARRPLCCACITAGLDRLARSCYFLGGGGGRGGMPHWCTSHVCSTVRDPHPPLWFGSEPEPPRPCRGGTLGTGREGSARGEGRHGRMAAEQMRLPGACPARSISACRPSPQRHTTRHRWMVRCQTHAKTVRSTVPVRR